MTALAGFTAASSQFVEASYPTAPHILSKVISCYQALIITTHFLPCSVSLCVNAWLFRRVHIETRRNSCMFLRHHPLAPSCIYLSVYWNRVRHWSSIQSQLASAPQGPPTSTLQHHSQPVKWVLEDRTCETGAYYGTVFPACLSVSLKSYFHAIMHRFQVFEVGADFVFVSLVGCGFYFFFWFCFVLHLRKPVVLSYNYHKVKYLFQWVLTHVHNRCILRQDIFNTAESSIPLLYSGFSFRASPPESTATLPGVWFYLC